MRKCKKITLNLDFAKEDKNIFCDFFKCSLHFRPHGLQSKLNKVSISNLVKFHKNKAKKDNNQATKRTINQCKVPYKSRKHIFCKNVLLYTMDNHSVVLEISIS